MSRTRYLLMPVIFALLVASAAEAGKEGKVQGTVKDAAGNPLAGVRVQISAQDVEYNRSDETNKKGKFTITLLDATHSYRLRLEKEGYQTLDQPIDPPLGGVLRTEWVLGVYDAAAAAEQLEEAEEKNRATKLYNEGARAYNAKDYELALDRFEAAVEEDDKLPAALAALARLHLEAKRFDKAAQSARRVTELQPDEPFGHSVLCSAYLGLEDDEGAEAAMLELERIGDKAVGDQALAVRAAAVKASAAKCAYNRGAWAVKLQKIDAGISLFERAAELDPKLLAAHLTLARIHLQTKKHEQAVAQAEMVVAAEADNAEALNVLYRAHKALGHTEQSDAAFSKLNAAAPSYLVAEFEKKGTDFFNNGQTAEAIASFEGVLKAEPENAQALYMLGLCYASSDEGKAKEFLGKFLELAPDHPEAASARAMIKGL